MALPIPDLAAMSGVVIPGVRPTAVGAKHRPVSPAPPPPTHPRSLACSSSGSAAQEELASFTSRKQAGAELGGHRVPYPTSAIPASGSE